MAYYFFITHGAPTNTNFLVKNGNLVHLYFIHSKLIFKRAFHQLSNGKRHVMPSADRRLELKAKDIDGSDSLTARCVCQWVKHVEVSILRAQLIDEDPQFLPEPFHKCQITSCYILLFFVFFRFSRALVVSSSWHECNIIKHFFPPSNILSSIYLVYNVQLLLDWQLFPSCASYLRTYTHSRACTYRHTHTHTQSLLVCILKLSLYILLW